MQTFAYFQIHVFWLTQRCLMQSAVPDSAEFRMGAAVERIFILYTCRRRIYIEEKATVVAAVWVTYLNPFWQVGCHPFFRSIHSAKCPFLYSSISDIILALNQ